VKALQLIEAGRVALVEVAPPDVADDQLLVSTGVAVICTSDLNDIRSNPFGIALPAVLGHEGAGTVVRAGRKAIGFSPGDRIAAHPVHPCGKCPNCLDGLGHLCSSMGHFGVNMPGTFAECFVVRADRARVLPAGMPLGAAALAEPVCVCMEALARARLPEGGTLLIIGDGPFGAIMARLAEALPLAKTAVAGHHGFRLSFAGSAVKVNTRACADAHAELLALTGGRGFDAVILATGTPQAVREGLALLKARGRLVVFSAVPGNTPLDLFSVHVRELEIAGACNDEDRLDEALDWLAGAGRGIECLLTHRFPLSGWSEAFELARSGRDVAMKVAFVFDEGQGQ
jgi:threonine dehydrogenase-like Zn-dependent dehydrogenase